MGSRGRLAVLVLLVLLAGACAGDGSPSGDQGPTTSEYTVVSQNLLHGIACAEDSDRCALDDRVALFAAQLEAGGCPDAVSVQEANQATVDLLAAALPTLCDGAYELAWDDDAGIDREVVLTTDEIVGMARYRLAGPLRTALLVRLATDVGLVDLWSTHLASDSDDRACDAASCPPPCRAADSLQTCQARQVEALARDQAPSDALVLVVGDLNAAPGEPTVAALTEAGYVDSHLAAGNDECDPTTGRACTSGRVDDDLSDLTDAGSRQTQRIDYVLYGAARGCTAERGTGVFQEAGGPDLASGLVHPADHSGVVAVLACPTTEAQRAAAIDAVAPTTTTTEAPSGRLEPNDEAAIEAAFDLLFNGANPDLEARLQALEDAEVVRDLFFAQFEATAAVSGGITVRIEHLALVEPGRVDVTYSLLLDDAVVLGDLAGQAVLVDGAWLVSRRTFCDVATTGLDEIPPACER